MSLARSVDQLGLSQTVAAALTRGGISTERQLRDASRDVLSRIPGIGKSRLTRIDNALAEPDAR